MILSPEDGPNKYGHTRRTFKLRGGKKHMKMKKIVAMLLALVMVVGVLAACKDTTDPTETKAPTTTDTTAEGETPTTTAAPETEAGPPADIIEPATGVVDESADPVIVWSWNPNFGDMVTKYYGAANPDFVMDYQVHENTIFQEKLDAALASGDAAPEVYTTEADFAKKYVNSENTLNINELGMSNAELADQYAYTYEFMIDDAGAIKAVSWQANPCGVFYNKTLAETYLGYSDPASVSANFATWDAFLQTARDIAAESNGTVKAISGTDDLVRSFMNSREKGWIVDGEIYVDPQMDEYLNFAKILKDEGLTFETGQWTDGWTANKSNSTVLSFWGPMWFVLYTMGFNYEADGTTLKADANPTTGDWDVVKAPTPFFWGGTWINASQYNMHKATTADLIRFYCTEYDSMKTLAESGEFVNNKTVTAEIAADPNLGINFLGGANPYTLLVPEADSISLATVTGDDQALNKLWNDTVTAYVNGTTKTAAEAKADFVAAAADLI
jgi:multiple sugar transport system substrate-binding protein